MQRFHEACATSCIPWHQKPESKKIRRHTEKRCGQVGCAHSGGAASAHQPFRIVAYLLHTTWRQETTSWFHVIRRKLCFLDFVNMLPAFSFRSEEDLHLYEPDVGGRKRFCQFHMDLRCTFIQYFISSLCIHLGFHQFSMNKYMHTL